MFYHPDNPPFKLNDLVVVKNDIWIKYPNGKEVLTFRKGEVLKVRGCWFFNRIKGWDVAFFESERDDRDGFFNHKMFQLKKDSNKGEQAQYVSEEKQLSFFTKIIKRFLP